MKKIYLFLIVLLCANVSAQTNYGVKAGYNLSMMTWDISGYDNSKFDSYSFFYIGGLAEQHLTEKVALQAEVLYTEIGGKYTEEMTKIVGNQVISTGIAKVKIITSQIQLPVSIKYYPTSNFSVSGGLNVAFNINSRVKTDFVTDYLYNGKTDAFRTVNIFPFLGTEYHFTDRLFADARYNFGVFNTAKQDSFKSKIGFMQVGLGYRFL